MNDTTLDQLTSAAISFQVDGEPGFTLRITKDGEVERMGYSAIDNDEKSVASCEDPSVFERFVAGLPSDVLDHAGRRGAGGAEGEHVVCRIELRLADQPVTFEEAYSPASARLSRYMQLMVDLGEQLTDEWYGNTLTPTLALADLPPIPKKPASPPPPPPSYEPPAAYEPASYEPPPGYAPPTVGEEAPEPEPEPEEEAAVSGEAEADVAARAGDEEGAGADAETPARRPARAAPARSPKASKQRFALAVVLDVFVLMTLYGWLVLLFDRALPLGAALFFLVLTEFCLLQFVRRSPGYWLLGMSAGLGEFPRVDPGRLRQESIVTHCTAVVLLLVGLEATTAWTRYQDPIPYFGVSSGTLAVLVSLLLGAGFVAAASLIFRTELLGVWIGAGTTALGFLSVWTARGAELNGWLRLELMAQRAAEGRPVEARELDGVLELVVPVLFAVTVLYGVGLYFTWKRLQGPPSEAVAPGAA